MAWFNQNRVFDPTLNPVFSHYKYRNFFPFLFKFERINENKRAIECGPKFGNWMTFWPIESGLGASNCRNDGFILSLLEKWKKKNSFKIALELENILFLIDYFIRQLK